MSAATRDSVFLEKFVRGPKLSEVRWTYVFPPRRWWNLWGFPWWWPGYDRYRLLHDRMFPLLDDYCSQLGHEGIPENVSEELLALGKRFVEANYSERASVTESQAMLEFVRIIALLRHPRIYLDPMALKLVLLLKGLKENLPWFSLHLRAELLREPHTAHDLISGLHRIILCDELWAEAGREMYEGLLGCMGETLKHMARQYKGLRATVRPRVDLLLRNVSPENERETRYHIPWCRTAFHEQELSLLRLQSKEDAELDECLKTIEARRRLFVFQHHLC